MYQITNDTYKLIKDALLATRGNFLSDDEIDTLSFINPPTMNVYAHLGSFVDFIVSCYNDSKHSEERLISDISIIGTYTEITLILQYLIQCPHLELTVASVNLQPADFNGYEGLYSIAINDYGIWCDKAQSIDGEYYEDVADVSFVSESCSDDIYDSLIADQVYQFNLNTDTLRTTNQDMNAIMLYRQKENTVEKPVKKSCDGCKKANEKCKIRESYSVNDKSVDKETFDKIMSEKICKDTVDVDDVRKQLQKYREFLDEMDQWTKMLNW